MGSRREDLTRLRERLRVLADALENSQEPIMSCEECQAWLPACVDAELEGEEPGVRFPAVWCHLMACDACGALYADLLEVSMLDRAGRLPAPGATVAPDLSFLPSQAAVLREWVQELATTILRRTMPESIADVATLCKTFFDRVEEMGGSFRVRSTSELALAFGTEVSSALSVLAATFGTTNAVLDMLDWTGGQLKLPTTKLSSRIKRLARREARRVGLGRARANAFASEYLRAAQRHLPLPLDSEGE